MEIKIREHIIKISEEDAWIKEVFPSWQIRRGYVSCERWVETEYGTVNQKVYLHRLVVGVKNKTWQVDHANRDRLDNRRENLRMATASQNQANKISRSKSGLRGVVKEERMLKKPYRAYIRGDNKKNRIIGRFLTPEEAARAYDKAAVERYGDFAVLNYPEEHGRGSHA